MLTFLKQIPSAWNLLRRHLKEKKYKYRIREAKELKVNVIYPKSEAGWIIYKFAKNVHEKLKEMGIDSKITSEYDSNADINHYFAPNMIGYSKQTRVDHSTTFMITHVDTALKLEQIRELTKKGAIGICMSLETRDRLVASGIDRRKICYINPAQDSIIKPRKITLGFMHRLYNDNRKKDDIILQACNSIDPRFFKFIIMGSGWEKIVEKMKEQGFEVEYFSEFIKDKYDQIVPLLDYYCYFGYDEGSMGYLDAVAAGIGTIVTPQGYHLDSGIDITYPVRTIDDIIDALLDIQRNKEKAMRFSANWTWENYTKKHLEIWKYITKTEKLDILLENRGKYVDGIFSLLLDDLLPYESTKEFICSQIQRGKTGEDMR